MCALFPSLNIDKLERAIVNISATLEIFQNATADALKKCLEWEIGLLSQLAIQSNLVYKLIFIIIGFIS